MTEKHKNAIAIALAALILSVGLLYAAKPDGSIWESILKAVSLPHSLFSFTQEEETAGGTEIVVSKEEDEPIITSYNPNETPFDAFGDDDAAGFHGTSPVDGDGAERNELPIHQVTGGG